MSSSLRPDDHRRKWDKAEYQRKAHDRKYNLQREDERRIGKKPSYYNNYNI